MPAFIPGGCGWQLPVEAFRADECHQGEQPGVVAETDVSRNPAVGYCLVGFFEDISEDGIL